jgi:hypothetical protein
MDTSSFSNSAFITVAALGEEVLDEEFIAEVGVGKFGKLVLTFRSGRKLSLNKTNLKTLQKAYGMNSDDWIGKHVKLYVGELMGESGPVDSVLLAPVSPPIIKQKARPKPRVGSDSVHRPLEDDHINFDR